MFDTITYRTFGGWSTPSDPSTGSTILGDWRHFGQLTPNGGHASTRAQPSSSLAERIDLAVNDLASKVPEPTELQMRAAFLRYLEREPNFSEKAASHTAQQSRSSTSDLYLRKTGCIRNIGIEGVAFDCSLLISVELPGAARSELLVRGEFKGVDREFFASKVMAEKYPPTEDNGARRTDSGSSRSGTTRPMPLLAQPNCSHKLSNPA